MPDPKEVEDVNKTPDGGTETPPVEPSKEVTSPEVKTEPTPGGEGNENADIVKLRSQVDNLNIALKQERDKPRVDPKKVEDLEKKLEESEIISERLKSVFVPKEEDPQEANPDYMTKEEAESFFTQKTEEQETAKKEQSHREMIKSQITELESSWTGEDGKPKYSDKEILKWQEANNKLYLTPKEAFSEMKHDEIIDYEVKQRLAGKKPVENVERPGGGGGEPAAPQEKTPQSDQETRAAIIEAMDNVSSEG